MMYVREKLVEMICRFCSGLDVSDITPPYGYENLADFMISNGVTVQEDCKECAEATQNCIVKLQEQIAEFRSAQEWIPVKDRLPDWRDGKVLVFTKYGFSICERTVNNRWRGQHANWITHWAYLPQPPKGE